MFAGKRMLIDRRENDFKTFYQAHFKHAFSNKRDSFWVTAKAE